MNSFKSLPAHLKYGMLTGSFLGLVFTAILFLTVDWYHDMLIWAWTNPWMLAAGATVGLTVAILEDKD